MRGQEGHDAFVESGSPLLCRSQTRVGREPKRRGGPGCTQPSGSVIAGMRAEISMDIDPDLVAAEARRVSHPEPAPPLIVPTGKDLGDRPVPSLASYDQLLAGASA